MKKKFEPADWSLKINSSGELSVDGISTVNLANEFGTPLYVLNGNLLKDTAIRFKEDVSKAYRGSTEIHYPFKCNSVPAVLESIKNAGMKAEVMTEFELELALKIGFDSSEIIVNGPCKSNKFLAACIDEDVKLVVVDSIDELKSLAQLADEKEKPVRVLLRVNPDYIPKGMNSGTATGSRKGSSFGLDLIGGEVHRALKLLAGFPFIKFYGFHFHIGTGIRNLKDYFDATMKLENVISFAKNLGFKIKVIDAGGGIASFTTRELSTFEMLKYQAFNFFPKSIGKYHQKSFTDFAAEISKAISKLFAAEELPQLIYEPGRCIVSQSQFLLLKVHRIKERDGIGKWIITDGGLGTITMPTYYEYHEIFLCSDVKRKNFERVTITGPCCFAADIVYKNKILPHINQGEIIAIMDTGAYFNSMESSFGFPRPAIVEIRNNKIFLVRSRETFEEMTERDLCLKKLIKEESK